jgi:hypothetical protein
MIPTPPPAPYPNRRRYDGYSPTMAVDHQGHLVAGDTVIDAIEREEVLRALNAYKNTKRIVMASAKAIVTIAVLMGIIGTTIYLLSIKDVGVLQ